MCQLLGMSCTSPMLSYSVLSPFVQRGGKTDIHAHGWGMAYYKHNNSNNSSSNNLVADAAVSQLQTIRDVSPAATSSKAQNILDESKSSLLTRDMIAHIRYATVGDVSVENVHPFQRELFGVDFVFAHNGDVPIVRDEDLWLGSIKSEIL